MAELCLFKVGAKVASWPILAENGHFGYIFRDMDLKYVSPIISIDIMGQTK